MPADGQTPLWSFRHQKDRRARRPHDLSTAAQLRRLVEQRTRACFRLSHKRLYEVMIFAGQQRIAFGHKYLTMDLLVRSTIWARIRRVVKPRFWTGWRQNSPVMISISKHSSAGPY